MKAKSVPVLPKVVDLDVIKNELDIDKQLIFGVDKDNLSYYKYDLSKEFTSVVSGNDSDLIAKFMNALVGEILYLDTNKMFVVNSDGIELSDYKDAIIVDSGYDAFVDKIHKFLEDNYKKYEKNKADKSWKTKVKPITCVILGISSFEQKLSSASKTKLDYIMNKARELGILNFIVSDPVNNLKKIEMTSWYKTGFNNFKGVWIGPGINDQYSIKLTSRLKTEITEEFALVVYKGKYTVIKYISECKLKENTSK